MRLMSGNPAGHAVVAQDKVVRLWMLYSGLIAKFINDVYHLTCIIYLLLECGYLHSQGFYRQPVSFNVLSSCPSGVLRMPTQETQK